MECKALKEIIIQGTRKCLDTLYLERKRYLDGINAIGLCLGYISNKHAETILQDFPYMKNKHEELNLSSYLKCITDCDFPGLDVCNLPNYFENAVPLMRTPGENTLYNTLSELYKVAMRYESISTYPKISIVEFVLLCFHLTGLLRLTANSISHMWGETIKYNSVLLLHKISTENFNALQLAYM